MNNYLFTLTITPVQSFISQARKTKDLFVGSEILSSLIKEVRDKFNEDEIIFPKNSKFVSNKIVAIVDREPQKFGNELKEFINNKFYLIGSQTLLKIGSVPINIKLFQQHFKPQLCNFFQVFWVAVKYDENNHQESYKKLEKSLGAVKNLRVFNQFEQISGRKCSVCGERNGLFYNSENKPRYTIESAIKIESNLIQSNETLCAVCFTKRFYQGDFPSLAKIALLDWLKDINYNELKNLKNFDEELFFEDNLNDKYLEKVEADKKTIIKIKSFIKDKKLDTKEQKKYYALIQFDIDSLGKTLSGLDKKGQEKLSELLAKFAKVSKEIVDKAGKTIYAGGDDFLGFVNLSYLFDVIADIQKAFKDEVKQEFSNLTYSTSIVIVHEKSPLHKVLDFSRELLAQTKNHFDDKNGVGIVVMSSSAINAQTICRYDDLTLLKEMMDKKIGMNLHYKLNRVFNFLDSMSFDDYLTFKQIIKTEIKRLLKREDSEFDEKIYDKLSSFFDNQKKKLSTNNYEIDFDNFIGFLKTLEQLKKVM
jgi:CRISPR-associated protein Cmr2